MYYLGLGVIVKTGEILRFKLSNHIFRDEDASIINWDTDTELFYAHDPELGYLVVRSEYADDDKFWSDSIGDRLVNLDKPTENIRRIAIRKPVRENPGGPIDDPDWEFQDGDTVHYVATEEMTEGTPKSFYILYTDQIISLITERNLSWERDKDRERLKKNGFDYLVDIEALQDPEKSISLEDGADGRLDSISEVSEVELEICEISSGIYRITDFSYLLVRFGVNEVIDHYSNSDNSQMTDILNRVIPVESEYGEDNETVKLNIPLRIHDRFPTEFKLFVDVSESKRLNEVEEEFANSPSCRSASISGSLEDRVYILLKEFGVTETPEGFKNNVVYPK